MAIITCPECGNKISSLASECPHCGCPASVWKVETQYRVLPIFAGTTFQFGTYPYDASGTIRPIDWHVYALSIDRKFAVLYSENIIDARPYHSEFVETDWDHSDIRYWLNNTFLKSAFSASERSVLVAPFPATPFSRDGHGGDYVFLPTQEDVNNFFKTDAERICKVTPYATANGVWTSAESTGAWWVQGCKEKYAQSVTPKGEFDPNHYLAVDYSDIGVRPMIIVRYTPDDGETETRGFGSMGFVKLS